MKPWQASLNKAPSTGAKEGTKRERERGLCQSLSQKSKTQSESQWGKKEQIMLQSRHIASGGALVIRSQS